MCTFAYRGKINFGVISLNQALNLVIVLEDCKLGMAECDVKAIE
jgi:hypothetical protein